MNIEKEPMPPPEAFSRPTREPDHITIALQHRNGQRSSMRVKRTTLLSRILDAATTRLGLIPDEHEILFDGSPMELKKTPAFYKLEDGDVLDMRWAQVGGKPVIYLFPTQEMDARVQLSLVP